MTNQSVHRGLDLLHGVDSSALSDVEGSNVDVPWLVHVIAVGNPILISFVFYEDSVRCVHLSLMSFAFVFLVPEALILAAKAQRSRHRTTLLKRHILCQFATLLLSSLGTLYAFQFVRLTSPSFIDLHSYHSRVGAMAMSFFFLAFCIGFVMFSLTAEMKRRFLLLSYMHHLVGKLTYILSIIAVLIALNIFEPDHVMHKGWLTYLIASSLVAQVVGMESILFPNKNFPKLLFPRPLPSKSSDHFSNLNYANSLNGDDA